MQWCGVVGWDGMVWGGGSAGKGSQMDIACLHDAKIFLPRSDSHSHSRDLKYIYLSFVFVFGALKCNLTLCCGGGSSSIIDFIYRG